ncbi:MAG: divalent-cation tolerance protein CutA [Defluviicoccus sp.]|nr:divalent-cation tolerance protein CutA [Defluviicoccus sp.]MDG4592425.1 divalent-cation tolerance protein CutA [Defluviicoccus sp.]
MYSTAPTKDEALRIARTVVDERLAACANVIAGVTSMYWWEGSVQEDVEAVIIMKTRADLVEALTSRVRDLHSYQCPCVVAVPIEGGNAEFLHWITAETLAKV